MLGDARSLSRNEVIETDLCIVGAGAAGITLAVALAGAPFRVCLLESGGLEGDAATQALTQAENVGRPYPQLPASRIRFFGGSTNCWEGLCRPLDAIDFREREWIPYSGWPFDRDHLLPWYRRAQELCGLGPWAYAGADWASPEAPLLPLAPNRVETDCFQASPRRFGTVFREDILRAANVRALLHANVVEIETDRDAARVTGLRATSLEGPPFRVRPRVVVLATGGLENPRLLLASNRVESAGLGNRHDLVGRFFMEHPHLYAGMLLPADAARSLALYRWRNDGELRNKGYLHFAAAVLERERIANVTTWITEERQVEDLEAAMGPTIHQFDALRAPVAGGAPARVLYVLDNECEQAPNPDSRVTLGEERDALGLPRLRLDWRLSEIDKRSLVRAHDLLAQEIGRAAVGRMRLTVSRDNAWPEWLRGGNHHMGTTRMSRDPRRGVVDPDGRVHGVTNLYVAGSSVFPTVGAANPTLTLLALALRLAEHLRDRLR